MPPLPDVSDVLRADLLWSDYADTNVSTRQFFRYSGGPPDATDAVALASSIYGLAAAMNPLWSSNTMLTGVRVTDLSSAMGGQGIHAASTDGTLTGPDLAGGTALLVSYVIQRRYRGGKPRAYFPWGTSGVLQDRQQWGSTFLSDVDAALATFYAGVIGSSSGTTTLTQHVNVSYYSGFTSVQNPTTRRWRNVPDLRATPIVDVILSYAAQVGPASQRRRNRT